VTPTYIKRIPASDGWNNPMVFLTDSEGRNYTIISYGRDATAGTYTPGRTNDFDCDIYYEDGTFTMWPEGVQVD